MPTNLNIAPSGNECNPQHVPRWLRRHKVWLLYKLIPRPGKKPRKVPYYANGRKRAGSLDTPRDRARLVTYDEAVAVLLGGRYAGLGVALGQLDDGTYLQGVDLDGLEPVNGLEPPRGAWVEPSPSGRGWHVLGRGQAFPTLGSNKSGIEAYAGGRFFTVTGLGHGRGQVCLAEWRYTVLAPLHGGDDDSAASG